MQDSIEKQLVIHAPIERVYQAVLDDFMGKAVGDIKPDTHIVFDFGEWGRSSVHVISVEPPSYLAYRWVPGMIFEGDIYEKGCTLVEFRLSATSEGTSLTLIESGFASLPAEIYAEALANNSAGWDEEVANFIKLFES
jgi:uncharacterized protein YndB with AHSA1/START domain